MDPMNSKAPLPARAAAALRALALLLLAAAMEASAAGTGLDCAPGWYVLTDGSGVDIAPSDEGHLRWRRLDGTTGYLSSQGDGKWSSARGWTEKSDGKAIGVVTVAGDIVDGKAGPGTAGGERIARLIDSAQDRKLAALVVRVDSPGGSVTGAEAIRAAIERQKKRGLPVVVSMANYAASGGYWVSTPATRIFAQPGTITGSIGIFAVIPSFEKALDAWGVNGDGVRTTPLSGQPDVMTGLTPEAEGLLQAEIDGGYARFLKLVATSRHKMPQEIDTVAQGRVWDGGTARQKGLVDAFGGLDEALAYAADKVGLKDGEWHAEFLTNRPTALDQLVMSMRSNDDDSGNNTSDDGDSRADWAGLIARRQQMGVARVLGQAQGLMSARGAQVLCVECGVTLGEGAPVAVAPVPGVGMILLARLARIVGV